MADTKTVDCSLCEKDMDWVPDGNDPVCDDCNIWCDCGNEGINEAGFCQDCI